MRDPKIVVDQVTVGEFFDPAGIGAGYFAGGSNPIVLNIDAYGISETNAGNPYPSADLQLSNAVDNHRPHFGEVMGDARFTKVISPITGLPYLASLNPDGSPAVMPDLTPLGKAWNAPYTATVSPISGNVAIANNFIAWLVIHAPSTATDDDFTDDGSRASAIGWDSVNASGYNGDGTGPNGITIALGGVNNTTRMVQDGSKRIHFGFTNWGLTNKTTAGGPFAIAVACSGTTAKGISFNANPSVNNYASTLKTGTVVGAVSAPIVAAGINTPWSINLGANCSPGWGICSLGLRNYASAPSDGELCRVARALAIGAGRLPYWWRVA